MIRDQMFCVIPSPQKSPTGRMIDPHSADEERRGGSGGTAQGIQDGEITLLRGEERRLYDMRIIDRDRETASGPGPNNRGTSYRGGHGSGDHRIEETATVHCIT